MVKVYACWTWNSEKAQTEVAPHKRTEEGARLLRAGKIMPETMQEVDASLVDDQGRYMVEWRDK